MDSEYNLQDVVRCYICDTSVYSMYCVSCLLRLCEICAKEHLSDKSKEHEVLPSNTPKCSPVCSKCLNHPTKLRQYYCRKCCIPVCEVCATVVEHKIHETVDIDKIFEKKKRMIKSDLEELQELLSKYQAFQSEILKLKCVHEMNFETFTADLEKLMKDSQIKKEYLRYLECDYKEKNSKFLVILGRQKDGFTLTISKIKQCIDNLMEFHNSNKVDFVFSYKSRNDEFKGLPQIPPVPMPHFPSQEAIVLKSSRSLPIFFPTNFCNEKNIQVADRDMLLILNEPRIITCINTMYGDCNQVNSVSCLRNNNIWTSGQDNTMRQYNMHGILVESIKTRSENIPRDITVTMFGELVYTDEESRTVNVVKKGKIREVIKLGEWRPFRICCTSSNDLLVIMGSDYNQTKVVRYNGSDEKQIIQFSNNGEPLFSSGYYSTDICENKNLDICVSDCIVNKIVVFSQFGNPRFTYNGSTFTTKEPFKPCRIASDSQSRILAVDNNNYDIHIIDQDGQGLINIQFFDLQSPFALCIDKKDNLILAECHKGKLIKIQYCMLRTEAQKVRSYETQDGSFKIQSTRTDELNKFQNCIMYQPETPILTRGPKVEKGLRTEAQKARSYETQEGSFKIQSTRTDELNKFQNCIQYQPETPILARGPKVKSSRLEDRGNWSERIDYVMSLLGYSVGLGTVWRFPYLAYSNGGGTFVFTFVLMFFLLGLPVMFLELALGQYSGLGQSVMFDRLCPLFHGIDYGMISVSGIVSLYYTVIIAWCIMYFFASITGELPWTKCDTEWATENCYSFKEADLCHQVSGQVYYKTVCYDATVSFERNLSLLTRNVTRHPSAKDFFERGVLHQSDGIGNIGVPQWKIMICLILAWFMPFAIFYFFHKGFKLKKKVGYFNILFHNVVLIILFSHGVTFPGAVDGIIYYLTPRFDKLGEAKVWSDAASQILFALGPAWGCLNTLSRYNHFHNNCFKDTLIVGIGNILNSLFAGVVVFSLIGYLAHDFQMPIDKVMDQGAGLPFIVYTDVLTRFSISPLFSVLVFVMMIILGMGSECALLETMTTAAQDTYPQLRVKKTYFFAVVCLIGFIGSLPVTCNGGMYILQLMDSYVPTWSVFFMVGLECVVIGWIYGGNRFIKDIEMMIEARGKVFHIFFKLCWKFLSPMTLAFIFVFNFIQYKPMEFGDSDHLIFSNWIGWILSLVPIILILTFAIIKILKAPKEMHFREKVRFLLKPSQSWGPVLNVVTCGIHETDDESLLNYSFTTSSC